MGSIARQLENGPSDDPEEVIAVHEKMKPLIDKLSAVLLRDRAESNENNN